MTLAPFVPRPAREYVVSHRVFEALESRQMRSAASGTDSAVDAYDYDS